VVKRKRKRLPRWTPGARRFVHALGERLAERSAQAAASGEAYRRHRARVGEAQASRTRVGQEIGPIPPRADSKRHEACRRDLKRFLKTYFGGTFDLPWSNDHLKVIARIEETVLRGGLFALAMPRGGGKTSLLLASAVWAVLYGHRSFVSILAISSDRGEELLGELKGQLGFPRGPLAEDFGPELAPFIALEGEPRRCQGQRYEGRPTHVRWHQRRIVFGRVPGSAASAAVISAAGLTGGGVRGQRYTHPGTDKPARPDLALVDDPQDDEIARSATQPRTRARLLNGAVLGMAGPQRRIAALAAVTVIAPDDVASRLLDRKRSPDWRGERMQMLYGEPAHPQEWAEYRRLREEDLAAGTHKADAYYRKHRKRMDAGLTAAWPARFDAEAGELSAIQAAMNLRFRDEDTFAAEYQNDPLPLDDVPEDAHLVPAEVAERWSGRARGEVPLAAEALTAFVDVHDEILYWCACAWEKDFSGHIVDYGTWPEQKRATFEQRKPPRPLSRAYPGRGVDGTIQAGLADLVKMLLGQDWPVAGGGGVRRLDRLLIDGGYKPTVAAAVIHQMGGSAATLSKGVGITAGRKPIHAYQRKPGERHGHEWYFPQVRGTREFPHLLYDTNFWKSFTATALATPPGDPGALTLFGEGARAHALFAEQVAGSEYWVETEGRGRTVREWKWRASRPDNHWWDCLVACAVAANLAGVAVPGAPSGRGGKRRRYSRAQLARGTKR